MRPSFFPAALADLGGSVVRLAGRAGESLRLLAAAAPADGLQGSGVLTSGTARYGRLMLVSG